MQDLNDLYVPFPLLKKAKEEGKFENLEQEEEDVEEMEEKEIQQDLQVSWLMKSAIKTNFQLKFVESQI